MSKATPLIKILEDSDSSSDSDSSEQAPVANSPEPKVSIAASPKKNPKERLHEVDEGVVAELLSVELTLNHAERHSKLVKCEYGI